MTAGRAQRSLLWLLLPVCACLVAVLAWRSDAAEEAVVATGEVRRDGGERLVIVVIDSLRRDNLEKPGHMERLHALAQAPGSVVRDVVSCAGNFTLPCMQTMMEGRQSPFSSGLHNVTGKAGASTNMIAIAGRHGIGSAIMSDPTLSTLYGRYATQAFNLDTIPLKIEERDVESLAIAARWLDDAALRLQLIHVIGTDYVAHYARPGSEHYRDHFHKVDEALAAYIARLDLARDHLLVLGDHGHDDGGTHVRKTLLVALGPRYRELANLVELPAEIDQPEIAWLVAYPLGLPLPHGYEGRQFLDEPIAAESDDGHAAAFVAEQRRALGLSPDEPLAVAVERRRAEAVREDWRLLAGATPLLLAFLAWIVLAFRPDPHAYRLRPSATAAAAIYGVTGALVASRTTSLVVPALLALPPLAALGWLALRLRVYRILGFCAAVTLLAGLLGYWARPYATLLHNQGGFRAQVPIFYAALPIGGLVLARILCRRGYWRALPETTLVLGAVCLPPGVYYYHAGQNLLWGFLLGLVLWAAADAVRRRALWKQLAELPRARLAAGLGFVLAAAGVVAQEAGGWLYFHYVVDGLAKLGLTATAAAYVLLAAAAVALMPTTRSRAVLAAVALLGPLYSSGLADLPLASYAVGILIVLLVALGLYAGGEGASRRHRRYGFLLGAGALAIFFIEVRGFFLERMDYAFAMGWAAGLRRVRDVALVVGPATALKYGFAVITLVIAVRGLAGPRRFVPIAWAALVLGNLKVLTLLLQSITGRFDRVQKLHELAMNDVVFVALDVAVVGLAAAAIQAIDRRRGAKPALVAATPPAPAAAA
jgi:hypothetical protein